MAQDKISMPSGIGGLVRYFDEYKSKFEIKIKNFVSKYSSDSIHIALYEEWQYLGENKPTGRLSTVIFREKEGTVNNLEWLHVHETWLITPP